MVRLASTFAVLAMSSAVSSGVSDASPITVGAGGGITQDQVSSGQDPNSSLSLFGRFGLTSRVSAELDITKVGNDSTGTSARTVTGFAVFDLGSNPHWVPQIFAGAGIDREDLSYGESDGHHFEGGLGLEFRATGGFVVGARFHLGGRSIDSQPLVETVACCNDLYSNAKLNASEFRTLDAYAGIRF
ncbi:MAG: outer membrane beta-barrel protein [Kofleriaceae bacterium]